MSTKNIPVDILGLSNRSQNALHRAEIHTLEKLLEFDEERLSNIRNLGQKSIDEILKVIKDYKNGDLQLQEQNTNQVNSLPKVFEAWIQEKESQEFVLEYYSRKGTKIDEIELLSTKTYNRLMISGIVFLEQILFKTKQELLAISRMEEQMADEIIRLCACFVKADEKNIERVYIEKQKELSSVIESMSDKRFIPEYQDVIEKYVKQNDIEIQFSVLSNRPKNQLLKNGFKKLSDIVFVSKEELQRLPAMGNGSVMEVLEFIGSYLIEHEQRIMALWHGDESVLFSDDAIKEKILKLYDNLGFRGLGFKDIGEKLGLPESVSQERLKSVIGRLLAVDELEYVDYRCYRVYDKFKTALINCTEVDERNKNFILGRLEGKTLENIAQEYEITRERVRQLVKKNAEKVRNWYISTTGKKWFDEDYYRYFWESYEFDRRECGNWLGISDDVYNYFLMMDVKQGKKDLQTALDDYENLDVGLRLKIKNYLNRNRIFVNGIWMDKSRANLEEIAVKCICQESISYSDFTKEYNKFLEKEDIEYDENLYYTEGIYRTRKNRVSEARFLLWKQNEQIRYYDIDSRDYTELLETLNLESYENIEISTLKFIKDYPDIMKKYDIRDQYELHNLLRKIIPEGSYHDFQCGRMPMIKFGTFDRDQAIYDIMMNNAPISIEDLAEMIHQEYGYDQTVVMMNYLQHLSVYYHQGVYKIEQKVMSGHNMSALKALLTDDFYYIDEVKSIYVKEVNKDGVDEINSYNLKRMGFTVYSNYVLQNYDSLDAYCEQLLTQTEVMDIAFYRKRFAYVQAFWAKLNELKISLEVVEFEPNQIIHYRKLQKAGITKENMREYCDDVFDFVEDNAYFSIKSIRKAGHKSELYDLGFSDWFYAGILMSDDRFSLGRMFGNIILYKGNKNISIQSFECHLIREAEVIDIYALMTMMTDEYGCKDMEKTDVIYKVDNTEIFYDKYLERFYASSELYYRELEEMEGM